MAQAATALPPEVLFALEPRASGLSNRSKWLRRIIAIATAVLLLVVFIGQCMKS